MTTANVEGSIPVCLPGWPVCISPGIETMELGTLKPPSPVLIPVLVVRDETREDVVGGAVIMVVSVHVVDPTRPMLV